jgi:apolipoprotein N-acyltransferase
MMTTFTDPMAAMVGSQAFSLVGLASPTTDLTWLAPVSFAAALWLVVVVARGTVRDRPRPADAATPAEDLKRAA